MARLVSFSGGIDSSVLRSESHQGGSRQDQLRERGPGVQDRAEERGEAGSDPWQGHQWPQGAENLCDLLQGRQHRL